MRKNFLHSLLFVLSAYQIVAQNYNFQNYSFDDGLTRSDISALCQDRRGVLWIGTNGGGLFAFDGVDFKSYTGENGVVSNQITAIYEYVNGDLWIGTDKGPGIYDGSDFYKPDSILGFGSLYITCITGDHSGAIWIGTRNSGVYRIDSAGIKNYNLETGLSHDKINVILPFGDTSVWIGTENGISIIQNNGIQKLERNDGLPSNKITGICKGFDHDIWIATASRGICHINKDTVIKYGFRDGLSSNYINTIINDGLGHIWLGTSNGVTRLNKTGFKIFTENAGMSGSDVKVIMTDFSGNTWFGTADNGLSKFDSERFLHFSPNNNLGHKVFSLVRGTNGNMIFGSSKGGITVFDEENYTHLSGFSGVSLNMVEVLFYDPRNNLWIGTRDKGLFKFNSGFRKIELGKGFNNNTITAIDADTLGRVWVSTIDSGVFMLANDTLFSHFYRKNSVLSNNINILKADSSGIIWVGSADEGLYKLSFAKKTDTVPVFETYNVENGLSGNAINTIDVDLAGNVFLGTENGINILHGSGVVQILKKDGIVSNNVTAIKLDIENNLWACTDRGVEKIILDQGFNMVRSYYFGKSEGFKGVQVFRNAIYTEKNGDIWFGTLHGAMKYAPWEDIPVEVLPKIHITGIRLFYEDVRQTIFSDTLTKWFRLPQELILPHKKNNLTFSFNGIYYRNPEAVRYCWMLQGFDEKYTPPLTQREASYSNLSPGTYTFKVIASNENLEFTPNPAIYTFTILPPVWQAWWFKIAVVSLIFVMASMLVYSRIKRSRKKNKAIQEKLEMEKNLLELEQEAARLQMNPHFIFNSLNSIQGFIATNDQFQAKRYLAKFARLMRLILENAREEFIPLQNEIDILDNYLELEKLSTNNKFEFNISLPANMEAENVEIPPMMIQPFVENAIVHGIKKKEGKGKISISFNTGHSALICEITDDGVGRKFSGSRSTIARPQHKSTGISVTKKRLEQYKNQTGVEAGVAIIDLEEDDKPAGTKVILTIPYESF